MRRRNASFEERVTRGPSSWGKAILVLAAVYLTIEIWVKRGTIVGVIALVAYGGIFVLGAFNHAALLRWSRRHVALDALAMALLVFLALAYLTSLPLWLCALAGLAAAAALVPVAVRRRRARR